jgi:hypothetical protein
MTQHLLLRCVLFGHGDKELLPTNSFCQEPGLALSPVA